jgi:hypothetical protein
MQANSAGFQVIPKLVAEAVGIADIPSALPSKWDWYDLPINPTEAATNSTESRDLCSARGPTTIYSGAVGICEFHPTGGVQHVANRRHRKTRCAGSVVAH